MDLFAVKVKSQLRNESSDVVNEFNLSSSSSSKAKLNIAKLVDALDNVKNVGELKKQLTTAKKTASTLDVPLHRQAKDKIERSVAYDETKRKVGFWDEIVRQNRLADKLTFPLKKFDVDDGAPNQFSLEGAAGRFQSQPRTELEIETAKLLQSSKHYLPPDEEYTEAEKEALKAMSIEEAERRKNQLCKMRALISYKTAQNKRQNAIKSKRYHRIAKKQQRKEIEKEVLELLRKNDPQGAKEKLELLEIDRVAERSTLRHKSTGKWAKQIRLLAKKDPELRQALQTQLKLGRDLAEKVFGKDGNNDEEDNDNDKEEIHSDQQASAEKVTKSSVKIDLTPKIAEIVTQNGGNVDNDDQNALISEAFADDDVMDEEVAQEMADGDDEENLNSLDAAGTMPGWNNWAGPGVIEKRRKKLKQKLSNQENKNKKRKPKKTVIISEKANESIEKFQVKRVPFPYSQADVFEENLAQPLGKEWNSSTSYKLLLEPAVRTKLGHIIEPMSRDNMLIKRTRDEHVNAPVKEDKKRRKKNKTKDIDGNISL